MRTAILILALCTPAFADGWVFTDETTPAVQGCGCGKGGPYVECRCRLDEIAKLKARITELEAALAKFEKPGDSPAPVVTIIGASWCTPCQSAKKLCEQSGTPYTYLDVDDPAQRRIAQQQYGFRGGSIPLVVKLDRDTSRPTSRTVGLNSIARRWCEGK